MITLNKSFTLTPVGVTGLETLIVLAVVVLVGWVLWWQVQDPAHRLAGEEVVPQVRYRVAEQGWSRVAEPAIDYEVRS